MNQILPLFQNLRLAESWLRCAGFLFCAGWISKFIRFSNVRQSTPTDLKIQLFLDDLKKNPKIQDWQVAQAENAVKLYIDHFCRKIHPRTRRKVCSMRSWRRQSET